MNVSTGTQSRRINDQLSNPKMGLAQQEETLSASGTEEFIAAWSLLQMYGTQPLQAEEIMDDNPFKTLPERLAELLLDASDDGSGIIHGLDFQTIADYLGTYRETIGAILRAFSRQRFVELGYGQIRVIDREALQEIGALN